MTYVPSDTEIDQWSKHRAID
eukprot:SAG25_NODE_11637_length_299_cov_1.220000_1_plen_20_part_10